MDNPTKKLSFAAMFLAIGLVLPTLVTAGIPEIGRMLLPMHLPVLLCGLICGRKCGLMVGFVLPFMRSMFFGLPVLFPMGISMAFELATYGFIIGFLYHSAAKQNTFAVLRSLLIAMVAGRIVWGSVMALLIGLSGSGAFSFQLFIGGALINAIPGIILQLILIPSIMAALNRAGILAMNNRQLAGR